jgi:DNA-binding NarL/FixJ family response regulator
VERLRVAVVSEDPLARGGLAARVAGAPGLALAAELAPAEVTAAALAEARAAAVAWDLGAGDGRGPELREAAAAAPLVALLAREGQAGGALAAGAAGVLSRDAPAPRLAAALLAAAQGLVALEPDLARAWLRAPPPSESDAVLTPRERQVLGLVALGLTNHAIADRLGVAERTAKFHVESILGKLGAQTRAEAVAEGMRRGLLAV